MWLVEKNVIPVLDYHIVDFGVLMQSKDAEFLCNNILIINTFYIHKCLYKVEQHLSVTDRSNSARGTPPSY